MSGPGWLVRWRGTAQRGVDQVLGRGRWPKRKQCTGSRAGLATASARAGLGCKVENEVGPLGHGLVEAEEGAGCGQRRGGLLLDTRPCKRKENRRPMRDREGEERVFFFPFLFLFFSYFKSNSNSSIVLNILPYRLSKINFTTLKKYFYFQIFFSFFSKPFLIFFAKAI